MTRLQVLDERIEAGVLRDHVEERGGIVRRDLPDVEGDVEVQGVWPATRDLDVLSALAHPLDRRDDLEGQLGHPCSLRKSNEGC